MSTHTCMGCGVADVDAAGRLCRSCSYARHESALVDYDKSPTGSAGNPAVAPGPAPTSASELRSERPGEIFEFESVVVRNVEFVSVSVAVEFDGDEATVRARRVDDGRPVDLRFEESEAFAVGALEGRFG